MYITKLDLILVSNTHKDNTQKLFVKEFRRYTADDPPSERHRFLLSRMLYQIDLVD